MRKVILFVIDSLHPVALAKILSEGNAPALSFLAKQGTYFDRVVSSFPTMTPVATSSMITGTWPDRHGVPGFIWYNEVIKEIVDYGATRHTVFKIGTEKVLRNLLIRLNEEHLCLETPTLYEVLEAKGYSAGNVNFFMYRGTQPYCAKVPLLLALSTCLQFNQVVVSGPSHLTLGQLIRSPFSNWPNGYPRGAFHRFGFNDSFSGKIAARMVREGNQPDLMVVYFPDNDKYSHRHGPLRSGPSIERADFQVAAVLNEYGSWEEAVEKNLIIVTGDHSQTMVGLGKEYLIDLDQALKSFKRLKVTEEANDDISQEIAICPNERMAFIYILQRKSEILPDVVGILAQDSRNAQIAWKVSENRYSVFQGGTEKYLLFSRGGPYQDVYGQYWSLEGDLSVVDAHVMGDQKIEFRKFPDALTRLISALEARGGSRVVVSAASGYEYLAVGGPIHPGGGSHGSLEEEDSTVPMIITGMPIQLEHPRIIDLFPLILRHFGL
ncbi:Type I phosphodiesterase / nucleotide pyrophosphatase family protein [Candidatus Desulfosporosinus infrequens]|uniref:Type I phosphodiesterase / nucleotide pyrophosphatase family protein n=1 Tax=Candidatus Desulfosporosinus infrequens TaxID=2043169 RepID=A0A2U3K4G3_9FIRM|nr:Type I phosphodiesterase / nucleotide pyrophosphatase family protein [Candidatus Desulfosporosinus infrequens]